MERTARTTAARHHDLAAGIVEVGDDGRIVEVTPRLAGVLGRSREALIGRPLESLVSPAAARAAGQDAFRLFFDASP